MKKYIILTASIVDIGGGQLYSDSKKTFMENLGWNVDIYSYVDGSVLINSLVDYKRHIIEELELLPMYYSRTDVELIISSIASEIGNFSECIIETHTTSLHVWGEMLACKIHAKHLIYELNEIPTCRSSLFDFFKFKFERGEMAGITNSSISYYFRNYFYIPVSDRYCLKAYYQKRQVEDIDYEFPIRSDVSPMCIVGIVGRLEKPFMTKAAEDLSNYIRDDKTRKYQVYIVGGEQEEDHYGKKISECFSGIANVSIYLTGYLFPIPRKLVQKFDIGISSSGAVHALVDENVPTISYDARDLNPIGIAGFTTSNTLFRTDDTILPLNEYMRMIQTEPAKFKKKGLNELKDREDINSLQHHIDFLDHSSQDLKYYSEFKFGWNIHRLVLALAGKKCLRKLSLLKGSLKILKHKA